MAPLVERFDGSVVDVTSSRGSSGAGQVIRTSANGAAMGPEAHHRIVGAD
jgi:hypothetical protein